jgi:hypothetical protein
MKRTGNTSGKLLCCLALLFTLILLTSGCASIIKGSKQEITFNSDPDGAKVTISGRVIGITPITTSIDRKSEQTLVFEKEGYKSVTMPLSTTINPWFWGNILIGGVIGSTTDGFSGAYCEYSPNNYYIPLEPIEEKKANLKINKKIFAMMNYYQLVKELSTEPGEYTKALIILMGVEKSKQDSMLDQIRGIAKTSNNGLTFAERIIAISNN